MSKDDDMVAVMLPRETVNRWTRIEAENMAESEVQDACKRALRPLPPTVAMLVNMKNGQASDRGAARISDFVKHVLKHGWEPDE